MANRLFSVVYRSISEYPWIALDLVPPGLCEALAAAAAAAIVVASPRLGSVAFFGRRNFRPENSA